MMHVSCSSSTSSAIGRLYCKDCFESVISSDDKLDETSIDDHARDSPYSSDAHSNSTATSDHDNSSSKIQRRRVSNKELEFITTRDISIHAPGSKMHRTAEMKKKQVTIHDLMDASDLMYAL